ncbi:MAG TPA: hypothetical protein VJ783_10520 [Pirellulales bacterium]|nr:hypothetical protein [Pirellulales bacterium]
MSETRASAPETNDCGTASGLSSALEFRRLRAPREDRQVLAIPALDTVGDLLHRPAAADAEQQTRRCEYDVHGRSLCDLANLARREMLAAARRYTASYRAVAAPPEGARVFLAGHQPQMFHPGVWYKNFALARLARQHGATAVNLIIDSDTLKEPALRVPGGSVSEPAARNIAFDEQDSAVPFAGRAIRNRELFESFGRRAGQWLRPLVPDPLLASFWPMVVARSRETENLGECLAQARHQLEGEWGIETLELPQSHVCQFESFQWFVAHVLDQLPRFAAVYNQAVADYRRLHGIRGANHPVPDLARDGEWLEAPFWLTSDERPERRRPWVRRRGGELLLSDRSGFEISLPLLGQGDAGRAVETLAELSQRGVQLRTRALTTTLFARLFLGDLFLHGIGGGKYDQLTDELIRRFFQIEPAPFVVLSATLLLPIAHERITADDARRVDWQLRELEFHPERHVAAESLSDDAAAKAGEFVAEKERWIATPVTRETARQRCRAIRQANEALQSFLATQRHELLARRDDYARRLRAEAVLGWREYAFCLYPEGVLREFLLTP